MWPGRALRGGIWRGRYTTARCLVMRARTHCMSSAPSLHHYTPFLAQSNGQNRVADRRLRTDRMGQ